MEKINLKLISDGTRENTKLVDTSGRELDGVLSIDWELDASKHGPIVTVTLQSIDVNIDHDPLPKIEYVTGWSESVKVTPLTETGETT